MKQLASKSTNKASHGDVFFVAASPSLQSRVCWQRYASMRKLKIVALCIFFSGCTSVERLGAEGRFQSMLGTKTLTSDGLICSRDSRAGMSIQNQIVWQDKNDKCYIGDTVASLKQGDSVAVTDIVEVKRSNLFKFQHWYIVGHLPNQAEPISFIYHWGMSTTSPDYPDNISVPKWK